MSKITGIAKIKWNGKLLRSKSGAELDFGGYERTAHTGHALYGFSEKFVPSTITCTLAHTSDTKVADLQKMFGATVLFECDSGVTYRVDNAATTKTLKLKDDDGSLSLEMQGDPAEEQ